jgi:hypothetical protein
MLDTTTFLTTLYVMIDDFGKASLPAQQHRGPHASLTDSDVVTLAVFQPMGLLWE